MRSEVRKKDDNVRTRRAGIVERTRVFVRRLHQVFTYGIHNRVGFKLVGEKGVTDLMTRSPRIDRDHQTCSFTSSLVAPQLVWSQVLYLVVFAVSS